MSLSAITSCRSIERANVDGSNHVTIVPNGKTFTPKQLQLDKHNGRLYWCDREGMRVMRSNLDGSNLETLIQTGKGEADRADLTRWCVGIAIDVQGGKLYWTIDPNAPGTIYDYGVEDVPCVDFAGTVAETHNYRVGAVVKTAWKASAHSTKRGPHDGRSGKSRQRGARRLPRRLGQCLGHLDPSPLIEAPR